MGQCGVVLCSVSCTYPCAVFTIFYIVWMPTHAGRCLKMVLRLLIWYGATCCGVGFCKLSVLRKIMCEEENIGKTLDWHAFLTTHRKYRITRDKTGARTRGWLRCIGNIPRHMAAKFCGGIITTKPLLGWSGKVCVRRCHKVTSVPFSFFAPLQNCSNSGIVAFPSLPGVRGGMLCKKLDEILSRTAGNGLFMFVTGVNRGKWTWLIYRGQCLTLL